MEYNRESNGRFAPKGTGDRTGRKIRKIGDAVKKVDAKYKPENEKMEKEWDDLYQRFYYEKDPEKKKELKAQLDNLDNKMDAHISEWEDKFKEAGKFKQSFKKGLGIDDVEDWEIGEAVSDMEWAILPDQTLGDVADAVSEKLGIDRNRALDFLTHNTDFDENTKYWDAQGYTERDEKGQPMTKKEKDSDLPF